MLGMLFILLAILIFFWMIFKSFGLALLLSIICAPIIAILIALIASFTEDRFDMKRGLDIFGRLFK